MPIKLYYIVNIAHWSFLPWPAFSALFIGPRLPKGPFLGCVSQLRVIK